MWPSNEVYAGPSSKILTYPGINTFRIPNPITVPAFSTSIISSWLPATQQQSRAVTYTDPEFQINETGIYSISATLKVSCNPGADLQLFAQIRLLTDDPARLLFQLDTREVNLSTPATLGRPSNSFTLHYTGWLAQSESLDILLQNDSSANVVVEISQTRMMVNRIN